MAAPLHAPVTLDEVLGLCGGHRTGKDRGIAKCPAHDDDHPSLSVREIDDRILLHDFGNDCPFSEIVSALGLHPGQFFRGPPLRPRRPPPAPRRTPPPARTEEEIPGARVEEELLGIARLILGGPAALARVPAGFDAQHLRVEGLRAVYRAAVALAAEGPHWPWGFPPYALARAAPGGDGPTVVSWARFALVMRLALREGRS